MVARDSHRDHVLFDVFAEMYASVEAFRDNIAASVIGSDVKHNLRKLRMQLPEFRCQDEEIARRGTSSRTVPAGRCVFAEI